MKYRSVALLAVLACFGVSVTVAGVSLAQQVNAESTTGGDYGRLPNYFGTGSDAEQVLAQLHQVIDRECALISTTTSDGLGAEKQWLISLVQGSEAKAKKVCKVYKELYWRKSTSAARDKARVECEEALFELHAIEYFTAVVRECVEKQGRLLQSPRRFRGIWLVDCNDPGGILPAGTGRIELELLADNSIQGSLSQPGTNARIDFVGKMRASGEFEAGTAKGEEPMAHVDGTFSNFDPPEASGSLWFGREVPGYAKVQCAGKWRSTH